MTHTNLHPGSSIRLYFNQPDWRDTIKQVGGNVVRGVPFGFLLPVIFPRTRGFVRVVLMTAFVMLTVEIAQGLLVAGRAFDIDRRPVRRKDKPSTGLGEPLRALIPGDPPVSEAEVVFHHGVGRSHGALAPLRHTAEAGVAEVEQG
ncbi:MULTISPECIES: VanZ family protein [unclassified Streptomyces]|uniref:VanZ family protein n=1 Tax=unclassified Streptomyces TaxID=2593676 RepID=UPI002B1DFBE7|nr:VanZ family protein [Streptomyces sp. NBC_00063]